jgi:hypothetical protein
LFFKAFYSKRISDFLDRNKPELSNQMKRHRLNNASILAVTVQFNNSDKSDGISDGEIIDADGKLLVYTTFNTFEALLLIIPYLPLIPTNFA